VASRLLENAWTRVLGYTCLSNDTGCLAAPQEPTIMSQKMIGAKLEVVPNNTTPSYCRRIACSYHNNLPCSIFGPAVAAFFPCAFWYRVNYFFS